MIGITTEEKPMAETIVMTMMDIMTTRKEVQEMLTTAISMNPWQSVRQTDDQQTVARTMNLLH